MHGIGLRSDRLKCKTGRRRVWLVRLIRLAIVNTSRLIKGFMLLFSYQPISSVLCYRPMFYVLEQVNLSYSRIIEETAVSLLYNCNHEYKNNK